MIWLPNSRVCSGCRHSSLKGVLDSVSALCLHLPATSARQQGTSTDGGPVTSRGNRIVWWRCRRRAGPSPSIRAGSSVLVMLACTQRQKPMRAKPRRCASWRDRSTSSVRVSMPYMAHAALAEKPVAYSMTQVGLARAVVSQRHVTLRISTCCSSGSMNCSGWLTWFSLRRLSWLSVPSRVRMCSSEQLDRLAGVQARLGHRVGGSGGRIAWAARVGSLARLAELAGRTGAGVRGWGALGGCWDVMQGMMASTPPPVTVSLWAAAPAPLATQLGQLFAQVADFAHPGPL